MSRNRRKQAQTFVGTVAAGVLTVAAVSGCGAGFSAETTHVTGAIDGLDAVANNILVRNAYLRGPANTGEQTELYLFLLNTGGDVDRLTEVRADFATGVVAQGNVPLVTLLPGRPVSFLPDSRDKLILRGLKTPLVLGAFEHITLVFARAGEVGMDVPVQTLRQAQNEA